MFPLNVNGQRELHPGSLANVQDTGTSPAMLPIARTNRDRRVTQHTYKEPLHREIDPVAQRVLLGTPTGFAHKGHPLLERVQSYQNTAVLGLQRYPARESIEIVGPHCGLSWGSPSWRECGASTAKTLPSP